MPISSRARNLRISFNLTEEEADKIAEYQKHLCAICWRQIFPGKDGSGIDHRHSDGLDRGYLCLVCNRGVASLERDFHSDPQLVSKAFDYLCDPPATKALGAARYGTPGRTGTKAQLKLWKKLQKSAKRTTEMTKS